MNLLIESKVTEAMEWLVTNSRRPVSFCVPRLTRFLAWYA